MSKLSVTERIIAEKTVCVLMVRGENTDGQPVFAYVAVRADRLEEFIKAQESGIFYPEEYGIIIEAGIGEPSEEVKEKMTKEYGFNHEAMLDVKDSSNINEVTKNITSYVAEQKEN
ncbi:MAG: hypothetical protein R3D71_07500 [Rickettsiales bacterium]